MDFRMCCFSMCTYNTWMNIMFMFTDRCISLHVSTGAFQKGGSVLKLNDVREITPINPHGMFSIPKFVISCNDFNKLPICCEM